MADESTCGAQEAVATGPWRGVWAVCDLTADHPGPHNDEENRVRWAASEEEEK